MTPFGRIHSKVSTFSGDALLRRSAKRPACAARSYTIHLRARTSTRIKLFRCIQSSFLKRKRKINWRNYERRKLFWEHRRNEKGLLPTGVTFLWTVLGSARGLGNAYRLRLESGITFFSRKIFSDYIDMDENCDYFAENHEQNYVTDALH